MKRLFLSLCIVLMTTPLCAEQYCNPNMIRSTPPGTFQGNGDGTVTDVRYGLMWKRCVEGQTWNGSSCSGTVAEYDWKEALEQADEASFAGYDDWRLPNINELESIVERSCYSPAIDTSVFDIPNRELWTSSPSTFFTTYTFVVDFYNGTTNSRIRDYFGGIGDQPALLVRGGVRLPALNDTGINWAGNIGYPNSTDSDTCVSDNIDAPQDCGQGRDVYADDDSDGEGGFSFTAIDENGQPTSPRNGPNPHPCVRDNVTGLMWEVKTDDGGLRDKDWTYYWYDSNPHTNGGYHGADSALECWDSANCFAPKRCDTQKYVADVNATGLCGYHDWRLPTISELISLMNRRQRGLTIDPIYFPNTKPVYWSSTTNVSWEPGTQAFAGMFDKGYWSFWHKTATLNVRLVRGPLPTDVEKKVNISPMLLLLLHEQ